MKLLRKTIRKLIKETFQGKDARKIIQTASDMIEHQGYQVAPEAINTMLSFFEASADADIYIKDQYDFLQVITGSNQWRYMKRSSWPWQTLFIIVVDGPEYGHVLENIHREIAANMDAKAWKLESSWDPESPERLFLKILT